MCETDEKHDRVMVIGAHPDDPEFGCAGTIAKFALAGSQITYVLLTSGDKGTRDSGRTPGETAALREEEQRAAARELGVETVVFLRYPDGLLENTMEVRRQLTYLIRQHRPHILMTIDPWRRYQLHPDHRAAGQAALDAVYAAREWHIYPEQLGGGVEPWRIFEAYLFWTDQPDHWEDVSEGIAPRIAALAKHGSQVRARLSDLGEHIRAGARETGKKAGYEYAEAFKLIHLHGRPPAPKPEKETPAT